MYCRACAALLALSINILASGKASAQVVIQPTASPTVTAENEPWYLKGEPVIHAGSAYYPAGPRVYFNANEMVRSGFHLGIPLYTRTTIEPYSVVYLPVGPGVMQPYERPRTGSLAETSGSLPSSLRPMASDRIAQDSFGGSTLQAAGSASQTTTVIPVYIPVPATVGTFGADRWTGAHAGDHSSGVANSVAPVRRPTHTRIGGTPQGSNSIFIEFEGERWYKAGAAGPIDLSTMSRAGTYAGVPVWTVPGRGDGLIYVPVMQQGGSLAVPYSKTRR